MAIRGDTFFINVCEKVGEAYPDVTMSVRAVDTFAGTAVTHPHEYDVVLAPNDWGSIMTDLLGAVCGSVGLCARANVGDNTGLFEPIHGTAPGKAGRGTVNPISQILSAKLMLMWLSDRFEDASAARAAVLLQDAVTQAIADPCVHTPDLGGTAATQAVVAGVCEQIGRLTHQSNDTVPRFRLVTDG
jgi:3-isopropylmalate dehydrogenase